jgi:hypothetical protein
LPLDHPGGENRVGTQGTVSCRLSEEQTEALLREVPGVYHTQINDVLLTALALSLRDWTGGERHVIALEGHGREELFEQLEVSRTVGWFTSVFPLGLDLGGTQELGRALQRIKEQLRAVPGRGLGYGILRYLGGCAELSGDEPPQVGFNYLGQFDQEMGPGSLLHASG